MADTVRDAFFDGPPPTLLAMSRGTALMGGTAEDWLHPSVDRQPCGALRPQVCHPGWECNGRNLVSLDEVSVYRHGVASRIPVVLPARALDGLPDEPWWDVQPFTGGDHLHYIPPPPPTRKGRDRDR